MCRENSSAPEGSNTVKLKPFAIGSIAGTNAVNWTLPETRSDCPPGGWIFLVTFSSGFWIETPVPQIGVDVAVFVAVGGGVGVEVGVHVFVDDGVEVGVLVLVIVGVDVGVVVGVSVEVGVAVGV